ncbi:MAG: ATPase [Paludibacteraceae bacterium]|nr:ATPase [Paludibacteraceae bacterium]
MILIADAGSTKTSWCAINKNSEKSILQTKGINPYLQTNEDIDSLLQKELFPFLEENIDQLFFYGAGCNTTEVKENLQETFSNTFGTKNVEIESDLLAAARSLLQNKVGIACIIGTGSNSCFYDGNKCVKNVSPLGYILGDEGSGSVLGKHLIGDFLKKQMPQELYSSFEDKYQITTSEVLYKVYKQPFPNRYLASFAPFLLEHIAEPYAYNLVFDNFLSFFERNLTHYDYKNHETNFVGSIAFHFRDVLEVAAYDFGLNLGKITSSPLEGLIDFHLK